MSFFGSNVMHHADCAENANLYAVYVDDQIDQIGKASFAVLQRAKTDLNNAVKHILDDVLAMCVIMRCSIRLLIDCRISSYEVFFNSGMAGPAEHRLFYLCINRDNASNGNMSSLLEMDNTVTSVFNSDVNTNFQEMTMEFQASRLAWLARLRVLVHDRGWNMTPEVMVMGLQCRLSAIHNVVLLLNKKKPISRQIDMYQTCLAIADIAAYSILLQQFVRDAGAGWTDDGDMLTRPTEERPRPVLDTGPDDI